MTDEPTRLLDESESELLRSLLGAAREEQPQPAALRRTLVAVGVGVSAVALASSSSAGVAAGGASAAAGGASAVSVKAAAVPTSLIVGKWLGFGLITGLIATTAAYTVSDAIAPARPAEPPPVVVVSPQPTMPAVVAPSVVASQAASTVSLAPSSEPAPAALSAVLPALSASAAEPPLAVEVATLDSARHALKAGDAAGALGLLASYERRFPDARMLPEALFIRMEALSRKGDDSGALAVAERLVSSFPKSPHAARARALLAAAK